MPRFIDSIQRGLGQGLLPADSPTFAGLTLTGLTASLPVVTSSGKALASLAYTGATSFRKNLGLETDDSPTFNVGNFTTLHTTTLLADHIGEHGSAHTVVFDNTVALPAATIVPDAGTIGLGSGKGRIQFDDETTDFLSFMNCNVGIGIATPTNELHIAGVARTTLGYVSLGTAAFFTFGYNTYYTGAAWANLDAAQTSMIIRGDATTIRVYSGTAAATPVMTYKGGWESSGAIFNVVGTITVNDVQVIGSQGLHVADATDAATVITQFNALLTRLEAHGLLASS